VDAIFKSNNVGRHFYPDFQGFYPYFQVFCPDFQEFCPDFQQIKTFGATLAPSPPTPLIQTIQAKLLAPAKCCLSTMLGGNAPGVFVTFGLWSAIRERRSGFSTNPSLNG